MPISTATKALLCLCPPAVMAGTVATVPAAKRAVHHWTAPRHAPARSVAAHAVPRPLARAPERAECAPVAPAALPEVPLVTYAAPIPDEPSAAAPGGGGGVGGPGGQGALALVGGGGGGSGGTTPVTPPVVIGAVPEPATWLMIISGVGALGMTLRRRRGRKAASASAAVGTMLWSNAAAVEAGEMAATAAVRSTVAAKTTAAGIAGKALLCVCPAAVVAGSVMTVPPLRHAVHASTAVPATAPVAAAGSPAVRPCDPGVIPVSAAPLAGLPASVSTVPATAVPPAS